MKTKKILAALFSAVTAISAVSPFVSSAIRNQGREVPKMFQRLDELDVDSSVIKAIRRYGTNENIHSAYMQDLGKQYEFTIINGNFSKRICFTASNGTNFEKIKEKFAESGVDCNLYLGAERDGIYDCEVYDLEYTDENVKKIREAIGDEALTFTYYRQIRNYYTTFTTLTEYYYTTDEESFPYASNKINNLDETLDLIMNYIEENNLDVKVDVKPAMVSSSLGIITIEPQYEITHLEHAKLAGDIYEIAGIEPEWTSQDIIRSAVYDSLDLTNYLNGDSNCDKKQTIADAVAILQFLGNPDDYPLSELGAFNADSDCNGITADDAVRIQQKDAGMF